MKRFEIGWRLIDWNFAAFINFVVFPCQYAGLTAVQHNVMLLIHLCELGVDRIFITSRKDTDKFTVQVRFLAQTGADRPMHQASRNHIVADGGALALADKPKGGAAAIAGIFSRVIGTAPFWAYLCK